MLEAGDDLSYRRDVGNARLGLSYALKGMNKTKAALNEIETALGIQRELLSNSRTHSVVREDMFDSLLALGELQVDLKEFTRARITLDEALSTAQLLAAQSKQDLYSERCLALVSQKLGDYHARLASSLSRNEWAHHLEEAENWYGKAMGIWLKWRRQNLAVPYAQNHEKEVAAAISWLRRARSSAPAH
jgi:tetratricopeptide (TPR) repeat protein